MKTAHDYLRDVLGSEPTNFLSYADGVKAVQAALEDAGTVRQQVAQGIADYFGDVLPLPPLPELPADAPPIRLGEDFFKLTSAETCRTCGKPSRTCTCEQPPF